VDLKRHINSTMINKNNTKTRGSCCDRSSDSSDECVTVPDQAKLLAPCPLPMGCYHLHLSLIWPPKVKLSRPRHYRTECSQKLSWQTHNCPQRNSFLGQNEYCFHQLQQLITTNQWLKYWSSCSPDRSHDESALVLHSLPMHSSNSFTDFCMSGTYSSNSAP